ncbi:hypothetical protein Cme02nite_15360 [Catellatospora methionotrophica]|uniref:Uncharacterized protein n=1 Tax=Catellatospora methionotrophica TaxID=121620 RepID=A0A8J3PE00_9ACTN|nr:hypothetical protein Cme02nite_15360 [Catellatospora methionotrophica]
MEWGWGRAAAAAVEVAAEACDSALDTGTDEPLTGFPVRGSGAVGGR